MLEFFDKMEYSMFVFKSRFSNDRGFSSSGFSATKESRSLTYFLDAPSESLLRRARRFLLASFWLIGLIAGTVFSFLTGELFDSQMLGAVWCAVSIVGLLYVTLLPFLLSALAVFLSQTWALYVLAFGKAFLVGVVGLCIQSACSGGWLLRWLLCFGSLAGLPALYWYWLNHIGTPRAFSFPQTALTVSLAGILGSIDYFIIAPLLARLIHS